MLLSITMATANTLLDFLRVPRKIIIDNRITELQIKTAERITPSIERHVSTQMSITNSSAIKHWKQMNVSRVVLARENTLEEIENTLSVFADVIKKYLGG